MPTICPAVTERSYKWKSPDQPHESNTDSPPAWGLQSSSPSTGKKQRASLQGHREESQGEGSKGGEPCEGSGTVKKSRIGRRRRLNRYKSKGKKDFLSSRHTREAAALLEAGVIC